MAARRHVSTHDRGLCRSLPRWHAAVGRRAPRMLRGLLLVAAAVAAARACLTHAVGALSFACSMRPGSQQHAWTSTELGANGRSAPKLRGLEGGRLARRRVALGALDAEGLASLTTFSVVSGAPIPIAFSALFRRAEVVEAESSPAPSPPPSRSSSSAADAGEAEPRDLMWAFPSFAVFLEGCEESAPNGFPTWARWLCLATFWPGVIWYLYYKIAVEEDLRQYRGLGIGGYLVIVPFAIGLAAGVFGEVAYGALEGDPLENGFSVAFYAAFAWIYLNQWFLYQKVNQLFEEEGRPAPLDAWGLFVPGWNFVTGIRQIHFLAEYWARQRGQELQRDAFAELFPFTRKPTLSFFELLTTPALWIDLGRLTG
eukprot:CAMPEP_0175722916 /NCGR_PEP_ID=MMETSP0097-20121207/46467_1 /TAXON_ID=311494 /ORGANISM="Alexandrium monilatum, Strain CCMP3105" /LENGTH=369 /DNA_ID=CAMNT_0017030627 /DNA_START=51 /DNA_END=1160 /DNA_ORIENTATION=-